MHYGFANPRSALFHWPAPSAAAAHWRSTRSSFTSAGAHTVLVVTPYYNKPTQEGLYQQDQLNRLAIELEPAPAMIGTRPRACSTHHSTTSLCSLWEKSDFSPVVPTGTKPLVPSAICQSRLVINTIPSI